MNTSQFILQALFFVVNTFALSFIVWVVCRICQRAEKKVDMAIDYIKYVSDRNDIVYINQLETLKRELAKEERYEEAAAIDKIARAEIERIERKKE